MNRPGQTSASEAGHVTAAIQRALGLGRPPRAAGRVGGGSINRCLRYETERGPVFVKLAGAPAMSMFEAEAAGLAALSQARAVRVPQVLACVADGDLALLILEWLELGPPTRAGDVLFGEQLARQHGHTERHFGWHRDNTLGTTPQHNAWCEDWIGFLRTRRFGPQLDLAERNGADGRVLDRGRRLCERLSAFFEGYRPQPSLLHGDLWAGNRAQARNGDPVVFDPAVYFGDREADIAMTRLFGGFGPDFYAAYHATWPLDAGAPARSTLYNLYHVLNHFNLFGGGYLRQARSMIDELLAQAGA
ncbi:MAG: hypothetical protein DIU71_09875 [Proteobacteria bacterium]|nr:MAG: hypothetical protein DIU71_09875 [Pseudomonadota bacterium]